MHGLGNDFVIIDAINQDVHLSSDQIRFIAERHTGVGCDQVLLVEQAASPAVDFGYRIYNADGNEVEQCGNGARCFARFVLDKGLTRKNNFKIATKTGIIELKIEQDDQVTVNMGVPCFDPRDIPFEAESRAQSYPIDADGQLLEFGVVSIGNPHAVTLCNDVNTAAVQDIGSLIESHSRFPQRVNVGFMQIIDSTRIKLRVYERGVGETQACGSGACAAVILGHQQGLLKDRVEVELLGGKLQICWNGEHQPVWMTGATTTVYEGNIKL